MLNFWWIRHAPVVNNNDRCYGDNEVECDISKKNQFEYLANLLPKNAVVYCSTLSRAQKTFIATVQAGLKYSFYKEDKRLKEQNIGKLAGMKYQDLYNLTKKLNVYSPNWLMKEDFCPDEGESFIQLNKRINEFVSEIINKYNDKDIVIFSHGGPIRCAINIALGNKIVKAGPFNISNLRISKLNYSKGNWQIDFVNK